LGYDYCLKDECQKRCFEPVRLASIGVNKAADYIMRADELLPPRPPARTGQKLVEDDDPRPARPAQTPKNAKDTKNAESPKNREKRPPTTLERLRRLEAELDAALDLSYQRFSVGELTAKELDRERDGLIRAFNQQVMAENIRYRSMLRRPVTRSERR
jgi:hypothetical protein